MFDIDINGMMNALLRNGILFGIAAALAAVVVFWRTLTSFITTPTVVGGFGHLFTRFLLGIGIGVGIVAFVVLGIRYSLYLYTQRLLQMTTNR
jgi:hypothetical protein